LDRLRQRLADIETRLDGLSGVEEAAGKRAATSLPEERAGQTQKPEVASLRAGELAADRTTPAVTGGPVPDAATRLARLIERKPALSELLPALRDWADDPSSPSREAAGALLDWVTWLADKPSTLRSLTDEELVEKLRLWRARLDLYLWADPWESLSPHFSQGAVPTLSEAVRSWIVSQLENEQNRVREFLKSKEIERIDAAPGTLFVPGMIERSSRPPEITHEARLHDRVFRVEPGEGGYRYRGQVIAQSLARRYEYQEG
jgi:hypothetical protein